MNTIPPQRKESTEHSLLCLELSRFHHNQLKSAHAVFSRNILEPISSFSHYYVNSLPVTVINMTYKNLASKCETAVNLLIQIKKVFRARKRKTERKQQTLPE